jgi:AcrR family transcriptional regulator
VTRETSRGRRTREHILDTAERLWSERGVAGVSMREIRIAAGQRNSSALQFHFAGRDGLLLALVERHLPRVAERQEEIHAALVAEGREDDPAGLVEVLVAAQADYLRRGPSERAWVRVAAEQAGRPDVAVEQMSSHIPPVVRQVATRLYEHLVAFLPPELAVERLLAVTSACNHLCADRARLEDAGPGAARPVVPFQRWRANLLDMAVAAVLADPATAGPAGAGARGPSRASGAP